jgi:hypothetical protein
MASQVITGSAATGYRRTTIDTAPGATLPPWILALHIPIDSDGTTLTTYVDNGQPGGTYQPRGVQTLPDLVSNVAPSYTWLVYLVAIGAGLWWLVSSNRGVRA